MKSAYYYYLRDRNRQPFGCVCIGPNENLGYSRGVSLCSTHDTFVKRTARKISRSRCVHAIKTQQNSFKINYTSLTTYNGFSIKDSIAKLYKSDIIPPPHKFIFKSEYNVNLTPFEYEIIKDEVV